MQKKIFKKRKIGKIPVVKLVISCIIFIMSSNGNNFLNSNKIKRKTTKNSNITKQQTIISKQVKLKIKNVEWVRKQSKYKQTATNRCSITKITLNCNIIRRLKFKWNLWEKEKCFDKTTRRFFLNVNYFCFSNLNPNDIKVIANNRALLATTSI